jgi:hypothetical protein
MLKVLLFLFLLPLATHAAWWVSQNTAWSWRDANWAPSGILPAASAAPDAAVYVLAGRTGGWKGIFAHHTWVVTKAAGAPRYTRYDVVGWGRPVRTDHLPPDSHWYSNAPRVVAAVKGPQAIEAIASIERAVAAYPYSAPGSYKVWPGPNSNTFIAYLAREVPELAPGLLPTAIGKDYAGEFLYAGLAPSGTGVQISLRGLIGFTIAWVEGVEFSFLGTVAGIDIRRPALKLPGWGRIGMS